MVAGLSGLSLLPLGISSASGQTHDAEPFVRTVQSEVHVALGPTVAAIHRADGWDSQVGGELHLVRLAPHRLHALGGTVGALTFAATKAIRLHSDAYLGLRLNSDRSIGVAVGPVVDLHPNRRAQAGVRGTLWAHAGVAPYLSITRLWGLGASDSAEISLGLRIPFSIANF